MPAPQRTIFAVAAAAVTTLSLTPHDADNRLPSWLRTLLVGAPNRAPTPGALLVWGGSFGRSPMLVSDLPTTVTAVAAGPEFAGAVTANGEVHLVQSTSGKLRVERVDIPTRDGAVAIAARMDPPALVVLDGRGELHETTVGSDGAGRSCRVSAPRASSVTCGTQHCAALARDGRSVLLWGLDKAGSLCGAGDTDKTAGVVQSPGARLTEVAVGGAHTLLLDADGGVYAAGADDSGQLGRTREPWRRSSTEGLAVVTQLSKLPVASVAAGTAHSAFLLRDGRVLSCGANRYGQTGHSNYASLAPVVAPTDPGGRAVAVFGGGDVTCVLRESGKAGPELVCVGANESGQRGVGSRELARAWRRVRFQGMVLRPTDVSVGGTTVAAIVPTDRLPGSTNA